jgi:hypothetical protein
MWARPSEVEPHAEDALLAVVPPSSPPITSANALAISSTSVSVAVSRQPSVWVGPLGGPKCGICCLLPPISRALLLGLGAHRMPQAGFSALWFTSCIEDGRGAFAVRVRAAQMQTQRLKSKHLALDQRLFLCALYVVGQVIRHRRSLVASGFGEHHRLAASCYSSPLQIASSVGDSTKSAMSIW